MLREKESETKRVERVPAVDDESRVFWEVPKNLESGGGRRGRKKQD